MVDKRYSDDWAKAESRKLHKEMLERTVLPYRKRKDIQALFFPGIDTAEIFEVYDPLGIPRSNLVGIERDSEIADMIEAKTLGIQIYRGTLEDYIRERSAITFDDISLDYTGPPNGNQMATINRIAAMQERDNFVLHCANLMKRDDAFQTFLYGNAYLTMENRKRVYEETKEGIAVQNIANISLIMKKSADLDRKIENGESLGDVKKTGYSILLEGALNGVSPHSRNLFFKYAVGEKHENICRGIKNEAQEIFYKKIDEHNIFGTVVFTTEIASKLNNLAWQVFKSRCSKNGLDDQESSLLFEILFAVTIEQKYFSTREVIPYAYISESGAPMIGDISHVSHPRYLVESGKKVASLMGFPKEFTVTNQNQLVEVKNEIIRYARAFKKRNEDAKSSSNIYIPERRFLGSSAKPVLTKAIAVEELTTGATVDDLKRKYRGWNNKPLAQWKAHVTMGTYAPKPADESTVTIDKEDRDLERITKEEALDLLGSGIPVQEIHGAYPTSFTVGQLRAFKAHQTMGTYE